MKYYIDPVAGVRAFESDGSQDFLITPEMRPLTNEELEAHLKPAKTQEEINNESRAYLASTDWYVIRLQETGEPVPSQVIAERAAARARVVE